MKISYDNQFLKRNGILYMFPWLKAWQYSFLNLVMGIVLAVVFGKLVANSVLVIRIVGRLIGFLIGSRIFHYLILFSNSCDNDAMLVDIKKIYDTLRIQSHAGVFINDSLIECYLLIRNRRLKSAMLELVNQIHTRSHIETAIDDFRLHFHSDAMDTLGIIVKQSLQSGQAAQILSDVSSQLGYLQHAMSLREKARMERKIEILELMIYLGVMGIGLYVLGNEFENMLKI